MSYYFPDEFLTFRRIEFHHIPLFLNPIYESRKLFICYNNYYFVLAEQQDLLQVCQPKLILCQSEKENEAEGAARNLNIEVKIVTFNKGKNGCDFSDFLEKYGDNTPVAEFK